jgi:hypothetical protein
MAVNGHPHEAVDLTSGNLQLVPVDKSVRNNVEGRMSLVKPRHVGETHALNVSDLKELLGENTDQLWDTQITEA